MSEQIGNNEVEATTATEEKAETGNKKTEKSWDCEDVYKKEVIPILNSLYEKCEELGIPHLFYLVPKNFCCDDGKTISISAGIIANACHRESEEVSKMMFCSNLLNERDDNGFFKKIVIAGALAAVLK